MLYPIAKSENSLPIIIRILSWAAGHRFHAKS
jgi:hypothetical protein